MRPNPPLRGQIYRADSGFGAKPWLVISNNQRNAALNDLLADRITTTKHANLPSWIPLATADPMTGWIVCDDLQQLTRGELHRLPWCAQRGHDQSRQHRSANRVGNPIDPVADGEGALMRTEV